ncbi:hypothetical protein ACC771_06755, partial [Rhizobium ruizarguesonis]
LLSRLRFSEQRRVDSRSTAMSSTILRMTGDQREKWMITPSVFLYNQSFRPLKPVHGKIDGSSRWCR